MKLIPSLRLLLLFSLAHVTAAETVIGASGAEGASASPTLADRSLRACRPTVPPRAVVLLIGDGLGISQLTLARNVAFGGGDGRLRGGRFHFESLPEMGLATTWSASNAVTESGAAATAFASGVKTRNRVVGVDTDATPTRTLADVAQEAGARIGYVTTTRVTHATPAAFYAQHLDRDAECEIAPQLLDQNPDVVLGGGLTFLDPESPDCRVAGVPDDPRGDLLARARSQGYRVWQRGEPAPSPLPDRLLGLLARSHLAMQLDEAGVAPERRDPSLADMTSMALQILGRDNGSFFLLVEGGRIDHGGHAFDAASVAAETVAFDAAVGRVLEFQRQRPDTLIVLTADHATGGLAINEFVDWPALTRQHASVEWMTAQIRDAGAGPRELAEWTGYTDWTDAEADHVRKTSNNYEARRRLGNALGERNGVTFVPRVDDRTEATHGHTGEDVLVYSGGPGAACFRGGLDNTDIPIRIAELLGWTRPGLETGVAGAR